MKTPLWSLLFLSSITLTLMAQSKEGHAKVIERVVAVVNSQAILLSDQKSFERKLSSNGLVDDTLLQITDRDQLLKDPSTLVSYLIDERVIDNEVKKLGMDVTFERVEQEIRNILRSKNINRTQLKEMLAEKNESLSQYQAFIKTSIERQSVIEKEISSRIKISDDDVAAYYLNQKGPQKNQIYEYSVAHILFLNSNGGEKAAKKRAEQTLLKIKQGQSFETMAEQYSEDPSFSQGGFLGNFRSKEMKKDMEEAIKPLETGQSSTLVKSQVGYQIFKVIKKTISIDPELEAKKEQYRTRLFVEAFRRQLKNWLHEKREDSFIKINTVPNSTASRSAPTEG